MNQKAVERQDGFVFNDDQFCVKLKTVAINQTEFQRDEKVRQHALTCRESHPIEVVRQTYGNSKKSTRELINAMLSLIESYVDMKIL